MVFNSIEIVLMETWSGLLVNILLSFCEKEQATFRGNVTDTLLILNIPIFFIYAL